MVGKRPAWNTKSSGSKPRSATPRDKSASGRDMSCDWSSRTSDRMYKLESESGYLKIPDSSTNMLNVPFAMP